MCDSVYFMVDSSRTPQLTVLYKPGSKWVIDHWVDASVCSSQLPWSRRIERRIGCSLDGFKGVISTPIPSTQGISVSHDYRIVLGVVIRGQERLNRTTASEILTGPSCLLRFMGRYHRDCR